MVPALVAARGNRSLVAFHVIGLPVEILNDSGRETQALSTRSLAYDAARLALKNSCFCLVWRHLAR